MTVQRMITGYEFTKMLPLELKAALDQQTMEMFEKNPKRSS